MKAIKIMIGVLTVMLSGCSSHEKPFDATGVFEATEVIVSAEQSGQLTRFDVTEGANVSKNQQVGLIDTVQLALKARQLGVTSTSIAKQRPDIRKQIAVLQQELQKAKKEQARFELLVKDGAANRKQLDDAISAVSVLHRQLEAQQSVLDNSTRTLNSQVSATDIQKYQVLDLLAKCHVTSPITGTVLEKYAEQGEFANIGKPLFKVADINHLFLRAYVTSAQLEKLKIGQQVKVMSDFGGGKRKQYPGKVVWISQQSEFTPKTILTDDERADLVYAVKIAVENDGYIKIGMYGEVKF